MNVFLFLKGQWFKTRGLYLSLIALLAISMALAFSVTITERMIESAGIRAADRFDILVGEKGSRTSLLLGTVYLRPEPLGLVPMSALEVIEKNPESIRFAAPIVVGDRVGASGLVGTTRDFVTQGGTETLASGRVFETPHEAVAGSASGFQIGETFRPQHAVLGAKAHDHDEAFVVKGIMRPTGTPWDRAVLVPIEAVWAMHGAQRSEDHAEHEPLESWRQENLQSLPGATAIAVKPKGIADAYVLRNRILNSTVLNAQDRPVNLMAVFTGEVLVDLMSSFRDASIALKCFAVTSVVTALVAVLLLIFVLGQLRLPDLMRLRVLGASGRYIGAALWWAVMIAVLVAGALSLPLGWGISRGIGFLLTMQTGIAMSPSISATECLGIGGILVIAALSTFLPLRALLRRHLLP